MSGPHMHSDSAVIPGTRHARVGESAQDYAIHRDMIGVSWGIASDGCSSGGRTDLGSRLWALALDDLWRERAASLGWMAGMKNSDDRLQMLQGIAPVLPRGAVENDLQATLVMAVGTPDEAFGFIAGDGALLALYANGQVELVEHRFTENMPAYPMYLMNADVANRFIEWSRRALQMLKVHRTRFDRSGQILDSDVQTIFIDDTLHFACQRYDFSRALAAPKERALIGLFAVTDGIFSRPRTKLADTVTDMSTFHSLTGSFLRRRVGWLSGQWASQRTLPQDDLSVAGVCWPPAPDAPPSEGA